MSKAVALDVETSTTPGPMTKASPGTPAEKLKRLVGIEALQELQNRFTELGQVTVCTCTVEGESITVPSWGSRYSELIGTSRKGREEFAQAVRRCVRGESGDRPVGCNEGMTLYTSAITAIGETLAMIVVGTRYPTPPPPRRIREIAAAYGIDAKKLLDTARLVDPYSGGAPEAIHRFADALAQTIATLYRQALKIERQLADLSVVHQLSEMLAGSKDLQDILNTTVRRVVEVLGVKACAIRLLNEQTGELVIKAVYNLSEEYLRKGPVTLQGNAIDALAFAGQCVYIEDVAADPRTRYPQNALREGIASGLCVPMAYRGRAVGVLRVYTARKHFFSDSEIALVSSIASQAASAIINAQLREEQVASERFQRQVEAAGQIQRRMLPKKPPQIPALDVGCIYVPTLQVGGDFYDFIELPGGSIGVCIADVAGKGLPAALLMASVRSALRASLQWVGAPSDLLGFVNRHLCRDTPVGEFATLFYGVFSFDPPTITYCNAGHPAPLVLRGGRFIELEAGGMVIGVKPHATYECGVMRLKPGDVLVMTTDGVTDAMDFHGNTFDQDRLLASIRKYSALAAQQCAKQILWDVRRFVGLASQSDDITVVVLKVS